MLSPRAKRTRYASVLAPFLAFAALAVLAPSPADAHFMITAPTTPPEPNTVQSWMSEDFTGGPQFNGPCAAVPNIGLGDMPGTPTHAVTVVQSGRMVTVPVTVIVDEPGWFRIALVEGPSSTQTLTTLPDPVAQTGLPSKCTPTIMANPVWSPTQPILADGLPAGSSATTEQMGTQTFQVMIPPTASCTIAKPCTLQVIMLQTDHPAGDCYCHHCADVAMGAGTTDGGNPSSGSGGSSATGGAGGAHETGGAGGSGNSGGVTGTGGGPGTGGSGAGGTGAVAETGGSVGTGGSPETAGTTGTGGLPGSGGNSGTGAAGNSSGTTTGAGGSGVAGTGVAATPGSSGCSCVLSTGGPSWPLSGAGLLALIIARRRRRR